MSKGEVIDATLTYLNQAVQHLFGFDTMAAPIYIFAYLTTDHRVFSCDFQAYVRKSRVGRINGIQNCMDKRPFQ